MSYIAINQLKNAWIFRHQSLPISDDDLSQIKPMSPERSRQLWDTFISKQVDHPDFFKQGDWPYNAKCWHNFGDWEKVWDSEEQALPALITEHLAWDNNTVIYFCPSRDKIIETNWAVFQRCWKNFLFMDDGSLLIGKKRQQAVQFFSDGSFKLGLKP